MIHSHINASIFNSAHMSPQQNDYKMTMLTDM